MNECQRDLACNCISVTHSQRPVTDSRRQSQIVTDSHKQSQIVTDHRHRQMPDDSKGGVTEPVRGVTDSVRGGVTDSVRGFLSQ